MPARSAYASHGDTVRTVTSAVVFVDFLGFARQIRLADQASRADELLNRIRNFLGSWRDALADQYSSHPDGRADWDTKFFTDNIVIGHPFRLYGGDVEMGALITSLCSFQISAIINGFFVRGGVACGKFYMDEALVFGVPLLDAHEAECSVANVPRIVLASSAEAFIRNRLGPVPATSPYSRTVVRDEDGHLFRNYLDASFHDYTEPPEFSWIKAHGEAVRGCLGKFATDAKLLHKYEWIAKYHNYWCESWRMHEYTIDGFSALRASNLDQV